MEKMKNSFGKLMLGLLAFWGGLELSAQTQTVSTDSIGIISLMEKVEEATSCKIYTNISNNLYRN